MARAVAYAGVAKGRWVVRCPFCGYVEQRDSGDWLLCRACLNSGNGHLRIRVVWPAEREQIERLLANRRFSWTRNYSHGETLDDLRRENIEHGAAI